jgi:Holliday junction DNA helicase RuvA
MFSFLVGRVADIKQNYIHFFVNDGFGFKIFIINKNNYKVNELYKIFVIDLFREEEGINLYGFLKNEESLLFSKLITVNGIGPKTAMNILKNSDLNALIYYIKNRMIESINNISGACNKGQSIVYELNNKMKEFDIGIFEYEPVYSALKNLGFNNQQINNAVCRISSGLTCDEAVKQCLRIIRNG